jgi:hypothetical protein
MFDCRVLGATGRTTYSSPDSAPMNVGLGASPLPRIWLDLEDHAKLQTKNGATGRELAFDGPGRVQPCRPSKVGEEEAWVLRGAFTSSPGSGEAPGQEEWVVSPLGVVRYVAATVKVGVGDGVSVRVPQGAAWAWAAPDAKADTDAALPLADDDGGWTRLGVGATSSTLTWSGTTTPSRKAAEAATLRCTRAAEDAAAIARAIGTASRDAGGLGELPVKHVLARRRARASCAVAGLRAAALPRGEGMALEATIAAAETTTRALPETPVFTPSGAMDGGRPR